MKISEKFENLTVGMQESLNDAKKQPYNSEQDKLMLKLLVRERMKQQDSRKAMDNKLGLKADGTPQDLTMDRPFDESQIPVLKSISNMNRVTENYIEKYIQILLNRHPLYKGWLKDQKGVGPVMAAWIIATIDIHKAENVSKITQYAGLNPSEVCGKKSVPKSKYKKSMGEIVGELPALRDGEVRYCVQTNEMIRGDKPATGFILPYNKQLRVILCGILADSFIKSKSYYANEFYYTYKNRLQNSKQITKETKKGGKVVELPWCECTKNHINMAARRYMIKQFVKDLYVAWRTIEGLPVRKPYEEEYLGKVHHAKTIKKTKTKSSARNVNAMVAKSKIKRRQKV